MSYWNEEKRQAILALIPLIQGKAVIHIDAYEARVFLCRRIHGLHIDDDSFHGQREWFESAESRPDELTDGMAISCDCLRLGPGWWQDTYFGWYFIHDPEFVARAFAGDSSWAEEFLAQMELPPKSNALASPFLADRMRPPPEEGYLKTEEVLKRLRGQFFLFSSDRAPTSKFNQPTGR